jgi:hypothetical protein
MPPFKKYLKTEAAAAAHDQHDVLLQRKEIARSARQENAEIWAPCRRKGLGPGCGPGTCCGQAQGQEAEGYADVLI